MERPRRTGQLLGRRLGQQRGLEKGQGKAALEHVDKQKQHYLFATLPGPKASQAALAHLCQMLFSTNEFLYIE